MLHLQSFTFNPFQENTYIIINEKNDCWIVDPGMYDKYETEMMLDYIAENQLNPKAIINTHTHIDHILGIKAIQEKYKIPFSCHKLDIPVLNNAVASAMMFGLNFKGQPVADSFITEQELLPIGDEHLKILLTPGHSPGSIVFYYPLGKWAIAGDVLFNGSIGRTDLPGGNYDTLINSIRQQMFLLPDETIIYPGHGSSTTIAHEKMYNPFLQ